MKPLFTLLAMLAFLSLNAQQEGNTIINKVTATWCPFCGQWGWDYKDALISEFSSGPVVLIAPHKSGSDLASEASLWYVDQLNSAGQPRFYFNNELNSVSGSNWEERLDDNVQFLRDKAAASPALVQFDRYSITDNTIEAQVYVDALPQTGNEFTVAAYVIENNVVSPQSGKGNDAVHTNIMRSSLGAPEGVTVSSNNTINLTGELDADWDQDEIGLLVVLYEKSGEAYTIANSTFTPTALLADNEELLDPSLFTYSDLGTTLVLNAADDEKYQLSLTDMSGRTMLTEEFVSSYSLNKTDMTPGLYVVTLRTENSVLSQQIFIN